MEKISPQLIVSLNETFQNEFLKLIIKYYGNIELRLQSNLIHDYKIQILLENFAILDIHYSDFDSLSKLEEVIYIDKTNYMNWI